MMKTLSFLAAAINAINLDYDTCHCFEDNCHPNLVLSDSLAPYDLLALKSYSDPDFYNCGYPADQHCTCELKESCNTEPINLYFALDNTSDPDSNLPCGASTIVDHC